MRIRLNNTIYEVKKVIRDQYFVYFDTIDGDRETMIFQKEEDAKRFMDQIFYDNYASAKDATTEEGWV